ncbi:MAG TPA: hypothetical protein VMG12_18345 [Polyangiaceae bacterium]|nr:hypothetical protein [Polyangiaceae bacterium]
MTFRSSMGRGGIPRGGRLLAAALTAACGSSPAPRTVVVDNSLNVTIHADGSRGDAPPAIKADDPRIEVAQQQIGGLLGHPLGFDFDEAVAAQFGPSLHAAYVSGLEHIGRALDYCKASDPLAFAHGAPRLERIHLAYEPTQQHGDLERAANPSLSPHIVDATLTLAVYPENTELLDAADLCWAFRAGNKAEAAARFAAHDPAQVPADQHAAYFRYLTRDHEHPSDPLQRDIDELRQVVWVAELQPHIVDAEVLAAANEWLGYAGKRLRLELRQPTNDAGKLTALDKAQAAWIGWVNRSGAKLERADRERVAEALFMRESKDTPLMRRGFDAEAFALPIVQQWIENAAYDDPRKAEDRLYRGVVCKAEREHADKPAIFVYGYCTGAFYSALAETPVGRKRLANLLVRSHNELFTQTTMLHVLRSAGTEHLVELVDALADDQATLHVALRALGDYRHWGPKGDYPSNFGPTVVDPGPLVASVPRWWKSAPEQRPALLYLLVGIAAQREGSVPWPRLAEFLGARIDAPALAGYLAEEPGTIWSAGKLVPALSPGWPRSRVLVPALDAYLDADAKGRSSDSRVYYTTNDVLEIFCESGTRSDVEALQKMLRARIERFPSQSRQLASFVEKSPDAHCPGLRRQRSAKPAGSAGSAPSGLFGD